MKKNNLTPIWENGENRKFDLSIYKDRMSDPNCVVNIEDFEFDNQTFKVPSSRAIRLGDLEGTETVNSNYNAEESIMIDNGSICSGDDERRSNRTEEEQLVKVEEQLYLAKLSLHTMTQRMKKKDEDIEMFKQQLSMRESQATYSKAADGLEGQTDRVSIPVNIESSLFVQNLKLENSNLKGQIKNLYE